MSSLLKSGFSSGIRLKTRHFWRKFVANRTVVQLQLVHSTDRGEKPRELLLLREFADDLRGQVRLLRKRPTADNHLAEHAGGSQRLELERCAGVVRRDRTCGLQSARTPDREYQEHTFWPKRSQRG